MVPLADLVEWDQNPRINEAAAGKLVRMIERWGFLDPLIVRRSDLRIVAGHTRVLAARRLGLTEVPAILLDLDDDEARDLAVAHNRVAEEAEWDPAMLQALVGEGLDLAAAGFDDPEIAVLVDAATERPLAEEGARAGRTASFTLHLWPGDPLEELLLQVAEPGEERASTVRRGLEALLLLKGGA